MEPNIVEKPAFKAVGLPKEFDGDTRHQIPALWSSFGARFQEIRSRIGNHFFGLCTRADGKDRFAYAAAVETADLDDLPEGMQGYELAAQNYAVFTVTLTGEEPIGLELGRANRHIRNAWLPSSGYVIAMAPDFEYYDERFDPGTLTGEIDLYVPIRLSKARSERPEA